MKRIKSKLRKLLSVASCAVILSCYFTVPTSAETTTGQTVISVLELNDITIGVFDSSGNVVEVRSIETIYGDDEFKPEEGVLFRVTTAKNFTKGELLNVVVSLYSTDNRLNSEDFMVSGSYELGFSNTYFNVERNYSNSTTDLRPYCYRAHRTKDEDGYHYSYYNYGQFTYRDTSYTDYVKSSFVTEEYNGQTYNYYVTKLTLSVLQSGFNEFSIALYNCDFEVFDYASYVMDKVMNGIKGSVDEGAQAIIENQNSFYYKDFDFPEPEAIDSTTTDNYAKSEEEIFDATSEGRAESVGLFNRFGSLFTSDSHLYRGLLAISKIFNGFFDIEWVSSIISFSLAIGIFAFVIGTGSEIFKSSVEGYKEHKEYKDHSSANDEKWLL